MRVLLIENDQALKRRIEMILRGEDMCAEAVEEGEDGIECAHHFDYDVIVLDLTLPDISGFEVIQRLRRMRVATPIIVLSGADLLADRIKALNAGADDCMTKPFCKDELVARIRAMVRRSRGHSNSVISIGTINLNFCAKTVEAHGHRIPLSGKEYQILELLALRCGVTVSKETLISHIYVDGEGPESYTIGLFMYRLRKKLAAAGAASHIETVRQQGYLIRPALAA
ncbi:MAG: ctrA [Alphaproteobacteria bacterium]|nr:ctrA [Alphaproteobacteria bacterium]